MTAKRGRRCGRPNDTFLIVVAIDACRRLYESLGDALERLRLG